MGRLVLKHRVRFSVGLFSILKEIGRFQPYNNRYKEGVEHGNGKRSFGGITAVLRKRHAETEADVEINLYEV